MSSNDDEREGSAPTEDEQENGEADGIEEELAGYVQALNSFIHLVAQYQWPNHLQLNEDTDLCVRIFRDLWRTLNRNREMAAMKRRNDSSDSDEERMAFGKMNEDTIRRFLRHRFQMNHEEDEPRFIDPKDHQPEDEHVDEKAKRRLKKFEDEWE